MLRHELHHAYFRTLILTQHYYKINRRFYKKITRASILFEAATERIYILLYSSFNLVIIHLRRGKSFANEERLLFIIYKKEFIISQEKVAIYVIMRVS